MGVLEIVLLIAGGIIFVLGFILPQSKEMSGDTKELVKEEVKTLVSQELDGVRSHVDDVVDEAVEYAVEKTERSLERLTNEKIMAVNEYSDTVLQEIHKNHEEVMFLYDMLNSKHTNLKNTVTEVNKTVKEAEETKKEAEAVVSSFQKLQTKQADEKQTVDTEDKTVTAVESNNTVIESKAASKEKAVVGRSVEVSSSSMDISFMQETEGQGQNSNEKILELYKQGKSNIAIAKELGLGVGEVKLVIGLYKNM
ncbi:MAG: hypothetical protein E7291_07075 [Lachnospiraceae bacterium]|nr:hypothetical protein [Lachnospiraceae bacterium]